MYLISVRLTLNLGSMTILSMDNAESAAAAVDIFLALRDNKSF